MIFVATERVVPLSWDTKRAALNNEILKWGLFSISVSPHVYIADNLEDDQVSA